MQRRKARMQRCECNGMRDTAVSVFLDSVFQDRVALTDGTSRLPIYI
jgi:hypothetical protein